MTTVFIIVIIIAAIVLGLIVLIQNPKGGGLTGNIAGLSNQFMGVKQTTDVLEKGTWIFAGLIGLLCVLSVAFTSVKPGASGKDSSEDAKGAPIPKSIQQPAPTNTAPTTAPTTQPGTPATNNTNPVTPTPAPSNAKPAGQ
jgi:preprotein translocase subunit SecG